MGEALDKYFGRAVDVHVQNRGRAGGDCGAWGGD